MNNYCPICGETLIKVREGVMCNTCSWRLDDEGNGIAEEEDR